MSLSVSIVDDDDNVREYLSKLINVSHHLTLQGEAKNVTEARLLITENKTDVYLVDYGLPDVDGVELIELIKSSCLHSKILVVTTFGDARHVSRSIRAGASGYLLKEDIGPEFSEKIIALNNGFSQISKPLVTCLFKEIFSNSEATTRHASATHFKSFSLTDRELSVLNKLVNGMPILNMSMQLEISIHTVNQHLRSIYKKLNVHSRSMAVSIALRNGFLTA